MKIFKKRTLSQLLSILINLKYICPLLPDKLYIQIMYYIVFRKKLNLANPQTFNEKLQWLKLYHHRPEYTTMADKYAVRKYIADTIGEEYLIPLIGKWDSPDDIDFNTLPNQFVLKCNHNSGLGMYICKDKNTINIDKVKKELKKGLQQNYFLHGREWCYKNIKPCIIAERFISNPFHDDLIDYKFYCFNGKVTYCQIITDRNINECIDFYDENWQHQPFTRLHSLGEIFSSHHDHLSRPENYEHMWKIAEILAKDIPFSRVDLYNIQGKIYFGEITFYPVSGFGEFAPSHYNTFLGNLISLPAM